MIMHSLLEADSAGGATGVGASGRGRAIAAISSLLIHVIFAIVVITGAAHVRHVLTLETVTAVDSDRNSDSTNARGAANGAAGANAVMLVVTQATAARLRFAIEKLVDHVWQSTLVAAVVGLLAIACRRNRARVRYALWLGASIKFFVPFTLLAALGAQFAWPLRLAPQISRPLAAVVMPGTWAVTALSPSTGTSAPRRPVLTSTPSYDWRTLALISVSVVWGSGLLMIVVMRVRMWRRLRDTLEGSAPMDLSDAMMPAAAWMQIRSAPGMLEPGVLGWREPVLLMPADLAKHLAEPEIEAIVAHELCHVRRGDNLTAAIHMAAEAVFWFHPLVWWIGARLIDERERACDEEVLCTVGSPRAYAQGILNVCKRYMASPLASVSGVSSANVRKRIDAILANRVGEPVGVWKALALAAIIAPLVIVPLSLGAAQPLVPPPLPAPPHVRGSQHRL
jgi:beta-lactamase regulating signal transducer with metallopeptidase domain